METGNQKSTVRSRPDKNIDNRLRVQVLVSDSSLSFANVQVEKGRVILNVPALDHSNKYKIEKTVARRIWNVEILHLRTGIYGPYLFRFSQKQKVRKKFVAKRKDVRVRRYAHGRIQRPSIKVEHQLSLVEVVENSVGKSVYSRDKNNKGLSSIIIRVAESQENEHNS